MTAARSRLPHRSITSFVRRARIALPVLMLGGALMCASAASAAPLPPPYNSRTTSTAQWNQEWSDWAQTTLAENAGYWKPILGRKFSPPRIRFLQNTPINTGCGPVDKSEVALYCYNDETIYVDALFLQDQEANFGPRAAQLIVDHEYAHHIQNLQGLPELGMQTELQADCLAGAAMASQAVAEQLDVRSLVTTLATTTEAAGDPSFWDESHGTAYERLRAIADGIGDLSHCQLTGDGTYYPQTQF